MSAQRQPESSPDNAPLEAENATQESSVATIPLEKITSTQSQPRRYFEPQSMQSLVESIRNEGILQPLLVRPTEGELFELVFGERRCRAALSAGLTSVPAIVRDLSDEQALQYALIENLQREDLTAIEETDAILQLLALSLGCDETKVISLLYQMDNEAKGKITRNVSGNSEAETVEQVFASLGRMNWQTFVRTRLPLLKLPEDMLEALCSRQVEYTKALEIAKLPSELERQELLEEAIAQSLTLSQIRSRVKGDQPPAAGSELQERMKETYKLAKKLKVWNNPKKRKKLEALLTEIELLLFED
jgi:ParB family chromosome partitioning protein